MRPIWKSMIPSRILRYGKSKNIIPNRMNNRFQTNSTIHEKTHRILTVASFFGAFPVQNIQKTDLNILKSNKRSLLQIYTYVLFLSYIVMTIYAIQNMIINFNRLDNIEFHIYMMPIFYFGSASFGLRTLMEIAKNWPKILKRWSNIEKDIIPSRENLSASEIFSGTLLAVGIVVKCISFWAQITLRTSQNDIFYNNIGNYTVAESQAEEYQMSVGKGLMQEESFSKSFKQYIINDHEFIINEKNYTLWKGILMLTINLTAQLTLNMCDIFLIMISTALKSQLRAVIIFHNSNRQSEISDKIISPTNRWKILRRHYSSWTDLIKVLDIHICKLIAVSMTTNGYFLSVMLLRTYIYARRDYEGYKTIGTSIYLLCANSYLLLRTYSAYTAVAYIQEDCKNTANLVFACNSENYTQEAENLIQEIHADSTGMTGINLIQITRSLIFTMYGLLVSYELLLVYSVEDEEIQQLKETVLF